MNALERLIQAKHPMEFSWADARDAFAELASRLDKQWLILKAEQARMDGLEKRIADLEKTTAGTPHALCPDDCAGQGTELCNMCTVKFPGLNDAKPAPVSTHEDKQEIVERWYREHITSPNIVALWDAINAFRDARNIIAREKTVVRVTNALTRILSDLIDEIESDRMGNFTIRFM